MLKLQSRWLAPTLLVAGLSCNLYAVDGVVLIDQTHALAGSVTPGDTPGFPVTISVPGSYRLSGNLTMPNVDTTAIYITANNVTIDLNGFSLIGPVTCTGPFAPCAQGLGIGIKAASGATQFGITVLNGGVRGFGSDGISLLGLGGYVEKVHADSNGGSGIRVSNGTVTNSTANQNGTYGIDITNGSAIGNVTNMNTSVGINLTTGTATSNTANSNGVFGIFATCPSVISGNTAVGNFTFGVVTSGTCVNVNNAQN